MASSDLIEKLKSLGFKEYEARVFIVLLKGVPMSASEISRESRVIRNSIYDVLKSFVEKGYCNEIETNTVLKYQVIDPSIIMDKIERDYNENYKSSVSKLKETFGELTSIYRTKSSRKEKSEINIHLIRGFNMHRVAKYMELFKSSHEEVLGMFRLKGIVTDELNEISEKFIKKGGIVRSIYQVSLDFKVIKEGKRTPATNDDLIKVCESFEKQGEKVRLSKVNIPNITIFDKERVFINLTGDPSIPKHKQADIIVQNLDFAGNMRDLFNHYWDNGFTIEEFKKIG